MERIERQELWCHECRRYVRFNLDLSLDGNHVLKCPNCGHEHCRVVKNGRITGDRWDSRNYTHYVTASTITYSDSSSSSTTTAGSSYTADLWLNVAATA